MSSDNDSSGQDPDYLDTLICQVRRRPQLWDRKHPHHNIRKKVKKGWDEIAKVMHRPCEELRIKWKHLKDSYNRVKRRSRNDDDGTSGYSGNWPYFKKLLFLMEKEQQYCGEFVTADIPDLNSIEDIKQELDLQENSNEVDEEKDDNREPNSNSKSDVQEMQTLITVPITSLQNMLVGLPLAASPVPNQNALTKQNSSITQDVHEFESRKRVLDEANHAETSKKIKETSPVSADLDEDMNFVKSLVPYLRKLNPIRKLIVRNEIQNLLIKELLCNTCMTFGPRPSCSCNIE